MLSQLSNFNEYQQGIFLGRKMLSEIQISLPFIYIYIYIYIYICSYQAYKDISRMGPACFQVRAISDRINLILFLAGLLS